MAGEDDGGGGGGDHFEAQWHSAKPAITNKVAASHSIEKEVNSQISTI